MFSKCFFIIVKLPRGDFTVFLDFFHAGALDCFENKFTKISKSSTITSNILKLNKKIINNKQILLNIKRFDVNLKNMACFKIS